MTQSTIDFILNHNVAIIQGIFAVIFLLVVFVILRSFKEDKAQVAAPPPSSAKQRREEFQAEKRVEEKKAAVAAELPPEDSPLDDLDNLDDLIAADNKEATQAQIDQTLAAAATAQGGAPVAAASGANSSANAELAAALSEKEKIIADLKTEIETLKSKPQPTAADSSALEGKVKELSEKLAEYEIIEDDIANLSFYKNENAKLKNELEKLKGNTAVAVEAAIAAEANPPPPPAPPTPEPAIKEAAPPAPTPAPLPPPIDNDAVLNEFEEAVKQKEALEKNNNVTETVGAPIVSKSDADLLKEFESVVEAELAGTKPPPAPTPAPTPTPAPAAQAPAGATANPSKVADEINPDKLVQELEALAQAKPPEVSDDGKDSNQKLIEEFENFVNKS